MAENAEEPFGACPELPTDVRDIFRDLCQDIAFLHHKWRFYLALFSNPDDVAVLNELAMASFQLVEECLRSDMTMSISRLSDPVKSSHGENVCVALLVEKLPHIHGLDALCQDFQNKCKPVRRYRNKRVGHNDLDTALKPDENPLPDIGRQQLDSILACAAQLMNRIYQSYVDCELCFEPLARGDGQDLLYWLRSARDRER